MSIKFKAVAHAQPGVEGGGSYKYYARICKRQNIDLDHVCERISLRSSLSPSDIWGVVIALLDTLPDYLLEGNNISLGDFGTFSLSLTSEPAESAEKLSAGSIKKTNVRFRPGVKFKKAIQNGEFEKVKG